MTQISQGGVTVPERIQSWGGRDPPVPFAWGLSAGRACPHQPVALLSPQMSSPTSLRLTLSTQVVSLHVSLGAGT